MIRSQQWQFILTCFALLAFAGGGLLWAQWTLPGVPWLTHELLTTPGPEASWGLRPLVATLALGVLVTLFLLWLAFNLITYKQVMKSGWTAVFVLALVGLVGSLPVGALLMGLTGVGLVLRRSHVEEGVKRGPRAREWTLALALFLVIAVVGLWSGAAKLGELIADPAYREGRAFFTEPLFEVVADLTLRAMALTIGLSEASRLLERARDSASKGTRGCVGLIVMCALVGFWFEHYLAVAALSLLIYQIVLLRQGHEKWEGFEQRSPLKISGRPVVPGLSSDRGRG